jgi:CBS domain-containing protein
MKSVKDILRIKGSQVWSVHPDATLFEALQIMSERNVGALVVLEGENLVGVISERDYARKIILKGKTSRETRVREVMSENPICVDPDTEVEICMALMTDQRVRHLPVLDRGRLVGVISIGDVVKAVLSEKEFLIEQLEKYIRGHR